MSFWKNLFSVGFNEQEPGYVEIPDSFWSEMERFASSESMSKFSLFRFNDEDYFQKLLSISQGDFYGLYKTEGVPSLNGITLLKTLSLYLLYNWLIERNYLAVLLDKYVDLVYKDDYGDEYNHNFVDEVSEFVNRRYELATDAAVNKLPGEVIETVLVLRRRHRLECIISPDYNEYMMVTDVVELITTLMYNEKCDYLDSRHLNFISGSESENEVKSNELMTTEGEFEQEQSESVIKKARIKLHKNIDFIEMIPRTNFTVIFPQELNSGLGLSTNKCNICVFNRGMTLNIKGDPLGERHIHYSQIVEFRFENKNHLEKMKKSIIGRAALGAVLLGPAGALVGGMTGIGAKEKTFDLVIYLSYYDPGHDSIQSIYFLALAKKHENELLTLQNAIADFK